jgi:hypothetical protein
LKATDAASAFDGVTGRVVTVQRQSFWRRRIFATFTGVFLRMGDTISPAKNALFRQPQIPQDWAGVRRSKRWVEATGQ